MKTYVVNLPERQDRLAAFVQRAARHGVSYEVFPAIKSKTDKHDGLRDSVCWILDQNRDDDVLIFEDDAVFCDDFVAAYNSIKLYPDWAMVYLGGMTRMEADGKTPCAERAGRRLWRTRSTIMTEAVLFSREANREVAELIRASTGPYDVALLDFQRESGRVYCCIPRLCWQASGTSDRTGEPSRQHPHFYMIGEPADV